MGNRALSDRDKNRAKKIKSSQDGLSGTPSDTSVGGKLTPLKDLTPPLIVKALDKYIVGQTDAKRALAVALRNRYRRQQLPEEMRAEVAPKNIMMIGPTGVGKTEIARRIARLIDAPFLKVEATKFTEVGYVGRDVESIVRDLVETSVTMVHEEKMRVVKEKADIAATDRLVQCVVKELYYKDKKEAVEDEDAADDKAQVVAEGNGAARNSATLQTDSVPSRKKGETPMSPDEKRLFQRRYRRVAAMLRDNKLEEQTIELNHDEDSDGVGGVVEFVAGITPDDGGESLHDIMENFATIGRRRNRRLSVREARRILQQEEANKLIDFDDVVELAVERAEQLGIVFVDEIDKIVSTGSTENGSDVSGEGVQRDLLPIVEGSTVMTRYGAVKTDHVLFVAAGAFHTAKPSDLIPELQGRFPLRVELDSLSQDDLRAILTTPENALTRQYEALLKTEEVELTFVAGGLDEIARVAYDINANTEDIGARRLQTVMERVLEDVSFNAAEMTGQKITIDRKYVQERLNDLVEDEDLSRFIL